MIIYIYSIVFDAFPLSSKIILEVIGLLGCLKYFFNNYALRREYRTVIQLFLLIIVWDIITSFMNGQREFHLIKDMVPTLGSIFGAQLLYSVSRKYIKSPDDFLYILVVTIFGESVLSILMKAFPPIYSFVDSFLVFDFGSDTIENIFDLARLFGIGNAHYFGVLASTVLGTMTAVYLMSRTSNIPRKALLIIMWMVISFTSFMTARWSILIVGLSFLYFIISLTGKSLGARLGIVLLSIIVGAFALAITTSNVDSDVQDWAFGYFIDSDSSDHSAEIVEGWWRNTRFDPKTFIIGDAQYVDPRGGYYMHVDVGYFREIFYGGIIGLMIIILSHIRILKLTYRKSKEKSIKFLLVFLLFGYLAAMAKGNLNMMTFYILYMVFYTDGIFYTKKQNKLFLLKHIDTNGTNRFLLLFL